MITTNQLSVNLKPDGLQLSEKELELIVSFLVKLAKYEYESYLENKRKTTDCQSKTKQEIGIIKLLHPKLKEAA
jgi:hypothetical protein